MLQRVFIVTQRLIIPPIQHPQRPQRIPAAGLTSDLQIKIFPPRHAAIHRPKSILFLFLLQEFNRIGHAFIARSITGAEIIQCAEKVIFPAGRERHAHHLCVENLPRVVRFIQTVRQQKFMSTLADLSYLFFLFRERALVLVQSFKYGYGCMER